MTSDLILVDPEDNKLPIAASTEWQKILEGIYSEFDVEEIPTKALQAMELLIVGFPVAAVANKIGTTSQTIRGWLVRYPTISAAITKGQEDLSRWRMSHLEKQFLEAAELSANILSGDPTVMATEPKLLAIQARQARYVMDLFTGKLRDLHITQINNNTTTVENVELKASRDSLEWLAQKLQTQDDKDVVEAEFRVTYDHSRRGEPVVDEGGEPFYGVYEAIDTTEDGLQCHICGTRLIELGTHIQSMHGMSTQEYENTFRLKRDEIKNATKRLKNRTTSSS